MGQMPLSGAWSGFGYEDDDDVTLLQIPDEPRIVADMGLIYNGDVSQKKKINRLLNIY